jgi:DUF917 family protein
MVVCPLNLMIKIATDIYFVCKVKAQPLMPFAEPCGAKKIIRFSRAILVAKGGQGMIFIMPPASRAVCRTAVIGSGQHVQQNIIACKYILMNSC